MGDGESLGWAAYVSSLEDFRKNLKQIHALEEEMSHVKRDRQILVSRLIKTTKSRPSKRDIKDMSSSLSTTFRHQDGGSVLSDGSSYSYASDVSGAVSSRETKRAQKMQEAQAELLGCEEHLRTLEVRIETERNKVMYQGLEERFHAMEAVGQMWISQAQRGLRDLESAPAGGEADFELQSNASLAPSQSASQIGYDERDFSPAAHKQSRTVTAGRRPVAKGPGSINGSIAEVAEEEGGGSSEDEQPPANLVMHENTRVTEANLKANSVTSPTGSRRHSHAGSRTHRKANSELGTGAYKPSNRQSLRRTKSSDHGLSRVDEDDDSLRASNRNAYKGPDHKKKGGFFASIARFFKGPNHDGQGRSGRDSPDRRKGGWHTRTDDNIKRASLAHPRRRRADSSSDEESLSNFALVANQPAQPAWTVAEVGRTSVNHDTHPGIIRTTSLKSRGTVTAGSATPRAAMSVVSKSPTVKSNKSNRSSGKPKTRPNGSIGRSRRISSPAGRAENSLMSIVDAPLPTMPDVPKAPSVGPQMELAKAPGSSLAPDSVAQPTLQHSARHSSHSGVHQAPSLTHNTTPKKRRDVDADTLRPQDSISRSNSMRTDVSKHAPGRPYKSSKRRSVDSLDKSNVPAQTPSKLKPPPLKSALRPTSPSPIERQQSPDPKITTLYSVHAPGPVQVDEKELDNEEHHQQKKNPLEYLAPDVAGLITDDPNDKPDIDRPRTKSRASYTTGTTGESVYESAEEARGYDNGQVDDDATEIAGQHGGSYADGSELSRRKSVRVHVPGEAPAPAPPAPAAEGYRETKTTSYITPADSAPRQSMDSDDYNPRRSAPADWGTRIGRMREDTSSEEDELDPTYAKARKHLIKNDGNFTKSKSKSKSGKSSGSIKSKGSTRSKGSRSSRQ